MSETAVSIRQIIDPENTLPQVELVPDPNVRAVKGTMRPQDYLIISGGDKIGKATVAERSGRGGRPDEAWFNGVRLDESARGQGFGLATYMKAIEMAHAKGETFRTHEYSQTEAAAKVWERFIDAGIAEVIEPPAVQSTREDGSQLLGGHVQIPPPTLS